MKEKLRVFTEKDQIGLYQQKWYEGSALLNKNTLFKQKNKSNIEPHCVW